MCFSFIHCATLTLPQGIQLSNHWYCFASDVSNDSFNLQIPKHGLGGLLEYAKTQPYGSAKYASQFKLDKPYLLVTVGANWYCVVSDGLDLWKPDTCIVVFTKI